MKKHAASRVVKLMLAGVSLLGLTTALSASWYIDSRVAAEHLGGPSRMGPYATRAQAEAVIAANPNMGLKLIPGGFDDVSSASPSAGNPSADSTAEKRRKEEASARTKSLEEEKNREEEAARRRKHEEFEKTKQEALGRMKGIADNEFGLKGVGADEDLGLKGLGGTADGVSGRELAAREQAEFARMDAAWMEAQKKLISQRIEDPNPWCASIWRSLKTKEPPLPYKTLADLKPGDVLLVSPVEGLSVAALKSQGVRFADRLSSWEWKSGASHTCLFLKDVNGTKLFLDNQAGEGPRIKTEEEILKEYGQRTMDVGQPAGLGVAQPLSRAEADKLWAAARELAVKESAAELHKAGNLIDKTNYGLFGDDNMVCSEVSRWALIKAGRQIPNTESPFKMLFGVYFGPANFYSQEQFFLISPLGR
jgi:hypothetical protein